MLETRILSSGVLISVPGISILIPEVPISILEIFILNPGVPTSVPGISILTAGVPISFFGILFLFLKLYFYIWSSYCKSGIPIPGVVYSCQLVLGSST